jgi:ABC-type transport system substrate-binding protein
MPKYYGQIIVSYATDNLIDTEQLDEIINRLADSWQSVEDIKGINWDDLDWTIHEEED